MKKHLLTILFLAIAINCFGQKRTITGRVVDSETKKSIANATVIIFGTTTETPTNARGYFQFEIDRSNTELIISHTDYETGKIAIPSQNSFLVALRKIAKKDISQIDTTGKVYSEPEVPAFIEEGIHEFYKQVGKIMKYPKQAQRIGIEGKVYVQFCIETDGSMSNIKVIRGIGAGCDEEAVRAIKVVAFTLNWHPAKENGKVVRQRMVFPINFSLGGAAVHTIPSFLGGNDKKADFLKKNKTKIKEQLPINRLDDNVSLSFKIDKKGNIKDIKVTNGLGSPFDEEAIRLYSIMPKWIPAKGKDGTHLKKILAAKVYFGEILQATRTLAKNHSIKGVQLFRKEKYDKALQLFTKAIAKNPTNLDFYFNRATVLIALKREKEACADLLLIKDKDKDAMELFEKHCKKSK